MALTELAQKYDIPALMKKCERSLKHAHEIAVIDRLLLADRLKLKSVTVCMILLKTEHTHVSLSGPLRADAPRFDSMAADSRSCAEGRSRNS